MRPDSTSLLRIAQRLYRLFLLAYPAAHRREYGSSMLQHFRDLSRDAYRQAGLTGLLWLGGCVLTDTAVNATIEHAEVLVERNHIMTTQQHARVIVSASLPFALAIFLFVINPNYIRQMLVQSPAQPVGWLMTAAVFILAGSAYLVQRKIFIQSELSAPDQATQGSAPRLGWTLKRGFALGLTSAFLVLPAVLLVVLGPAFLYAIELLGK